MNNDYWAVLIGEVLINRCLERKYDISKSKLQSLLYLMQKEHVKRFHQVMFGDKIIAGERGPLIPNVYTYFGIDVDKPCQEQICLLDKHKEVMEYILGVYGHLSTFTLMQKTQDLLWRKALSRGTNSEITQDDFFEYNFEQEARENEWLRCSRTWTKW